MHYFLSLLLAFIGLHVSFQSAGSTSVSELNVSNGMNWGSWRYKDMCPTGTYAMGFSLRVEEPSYVIYDDTALNGIRLHCVDPSKQSSDSEKDYATVQSDVGNWGVWTQIKWCPSGFLTAFQLRVESSQGIGDDTAANNIKFKCSQGSLLQGDGTAWGEWGEWSDVCEKGICGLKTQIEEPQGRGDDTALNNVVMYCCN